MLLSIAAMRSSRLGRNSQAVPPRLYINLPKSPQPARQDSDRTATMEVAIESEAPLAVGEFFDALVRARRDEALPDDPQQVFSSGACKLLELKAAHRRLCENTDALREAASEAKSQLDDSSLQLQNLLYERQHYEKEIGSCRGWRSAYSDEQVGDGGLWLYQLPLPGSMPGHHQLATKR